MVFNAVVVGADRIAANGDVANKIGTYNVAVLAHENGIPFYVAAPVSTLDIHTPTQRKHCISDTDNTRNHVKFCNVQSVSHKPMAKLEANMLEMSAA